MSILFASCDLMSLKLISPNSTKHHFTADLLHYSTVFSKFATNYFSRIFGKFCLNKVPVLHRQISTGTFGSGIQHKMEQSNC